MTQDRKPSARRFIWWGLAILLIIVFFTVRILTRDRLLVRAAAASHVPLESTISTNGRIEPVLNYQMYSPIATTVKAIYVQPGDKVEAGKLLMELDSTEARARLATAESGVKAAQAEWDAATHNGSLQERQAAAADETRARLERDEARRGLDALTKLNASGAASASEVAAARQRLESAEASLHALELNAKGRYSPADLDRVRAALAEAEANLAAARQVVAQTQIHAPASGTVYSIGPGRTEFVEAGKLLIQLADLSNEQVRAYFDEPELGSLAVGQKIQVKWDARPNSLWYGHIARLPVTVIHLDTRSVGEVLIQIDGSNGGLLPDTNVTATVTIHSEPNALSIPREALHSENGKAYVYKVVKDGTQLQKVYVATGAINLTQVAILSGIAEGEMVVTGTADNMPLKEGLPIKVVR
jgi:HlyD family secretion protein